MKKFIIYIIIIFIIYLFGLEITTRIFGLSAHTLEQENINGDRFLKIGSEGYWVQGGQRELVNHYKINDQGFNSLVDYSNLKKDKINIAIIGDSYIEGLHTEVENSIGRILEKETNNKFVVHEYGQSGGNIVDFSLLYEKYIKNKYDYTFILMTNGDIIDKNPSFMGRGEEIPKVSIIRKLYNNISFIRYFNINHGLSVKVDNFFSKFSKNSSESNSDLNVNEINFEAFKVFDSSVIILYEEEKLDTSAIAKTKLATLKIKHFYKPFDHGFDNHWNYYGRKNCAISIKNYFIENSHLMKRK